MTIITRHIRGSLPKLGVGLVLALSRKFDGDGGCGREGGHFAAEGGGVRALDLPREEGSQRREAINDDDDDWTIVENEDGVREAVRRPPPSYEDSTRR